MIEPQVSKVLVDHNELNNINVQSGSDFAILETSDRLSRARTRPPTSKKYFHHKRTTVLESSASNYNQATGNLLTGSAPATMRQKSPYSARPHTARTNIAPKKQPSTKGNIQGLYFADYLNSEKETSSRLKGLTNSGHFRQYRNSMPHKSTEANSTLAESHRLTMTQRKPIDKNWIASTWHASGSEMLAPSSARQTVQ